MTEAQKLLHVLLVAANAKTDEEEARIAWRASDYMWRHPIIYGIGFCRQFNNLLQDQNWPWVEHLWSAEEIQEWRGRERAEAEGRLRPT